MRILGVVVEQALDLPSAARVFYPGNLTLQRKWIHAYLQAPGARCPVGKLTDAEHLERGRLRALAYLSRRVGMPAATPSKQEEAPAPRAHLIRRVV